MNSEEFRAFRKHCESRLKLRRDDILQLFSISTSTLSRWENADGELPLTKDQEEKMVTLQELLSLADRNEVDPAKLTGYLRQAGIIGAAAACVAIGCTLVGPLAVLGSLFSKAALSALAGGAAGALTLNVTKSRSQGKTAESRTSRRRTGREEDSGEKK